MTKDYTQQLDELFIGSVCEKTLIQTILITIESVGPEVTWDHFEAYLASKIPADDELFDNLQAYIFSVFQESEISQEMHGNNFVKLTFNNPQTAQAFFDFTQHVFPIINSEYPKIDNTETLLTEDQLFFCRRGAKLKTGDLPSDFLSEHFLKTLRADEHDFSDRFIKGLIPSSNGSRQLQNLRPFRRLPYTIAGDGSVISRTSRAASKTAFKEGFTQIQSCTLLDAKGLTPAFGFDKERNPKLYGILTHRNDLIMSRLLLNDGGTVCRPFEAEATQPGEQRASQFRNRNKPHLFHPNEYEDFKTENIKARRKKQKTNETLARIRFNIFRSMICICADDLEARLLSYDFSEEILEYYTEHAKNTGGQINPRFKLPIIFYLKHPETNFASNIKKKLTGNEAIHKIFKQTLKMRRGDLYLANVFNNFNFNRMEKYRNNDYEFLLGLETITLELLLENTENNIPLAAEMMEKGYTRMLLRLVRPTRKQTPKSIHGSATFSEILFDSLLAKRAFTKNDEIIPQLILAEAFKLADKLLNATKLKVEDLKYDNISLIDYVLARGNPRHFHYLGLDFMLSKAVRAKNWVAIRLCLKEFDNISSATIDLLFSEACKGQYSDFNEPDIVFLLKRKNVSINCIEAELKKAIMTNKWTLIELIITYYDELSHQIDFGMGLFLAVQQKKPKLAALILTKEPTNIWRKTEGKNYYLNSAVLYAIEYEFDDILQQLIDYEESYQDQYTDARRALAIDMATIKKNNVAIDLFHNSRKPDEFILLNDVNLSICHYIFEAFFANQPEIAEYRLKSLMKQCDLSIANFKNIIQTLTFFSESFQPALNNFKDLINYFVPYSVGGHHFKRINYINSFFDCVVKLSLKYHNIFLLRTLQTIIHENFGIDKEEIERIIIESSLKIISSKYIETILSLIQTSIFPDEWKDTILEKFKSATATHVSKHDYNEHSALLLHLILAIQKMRNVCLLDTTILRTAFKHAVGTTNTTLTHYLLNDTKLTVLLKDELFSIAFQYSSTRFFSYLMKNYQFTINQEQITLSNIQNRSYWKAIVTLQELTKNKYNNTFSHWDYFSLWAECSSTELLNSDFKSSRKLFALILDHNVIRHFTLLTLLAYFTNRYREIYLTDSWPNIQAILDNKSVKVFVKHISGEGIWSNEEKNMDYHQALLDTFNNYFDGTDKIPECDIVNQTYQLVLGILKTAITKPWLSYFFPSPIYAGFTGALYCYLKGVDDFLTQQQTVPLKHDSADRQALHRNIDVIFSDQKISIR
ncbi:MAG: hypothetical protein K2X50_00390 [Gammaproteobacteria bacterium]|nr:hypothetical protein [Gammaproteobacteria bacterium]